MSPQLLSLTRQRRAILLFSVVICVFIITISSLYASPTQYNKVREYLPAWRPTALKHSPTSNEAEQHVKSTQELLPEYNVESTATPFCADRFGLKYLENLRDSAVGYCTSESPVNLTCFHSTTALDGRIDSMCIGKSAAFLTEQAKFTIPCQLRDLTDQEKTKGIPTLDSLTSYWYETGPHVVFDRAITFSPAATAPIPTSNYTILVKREGAENLWHCLMEIDAVFTTIDVLRMSKELGQDEPFFALADVNNTQVVFLDERAHGPYYDLWTMFAQRPPVKMKEISDISKIENIIVPLAGASNPLWLSDWIIHSCERSAFLQVFIRRVLNFYRIEPGEPHQGDILVTFIDRKESRHLINQANYLKTLTERVPHVKIQAVDFSAITFAEQLRIIHETDVLLGVHGAGLTHGMFLREGSVMVEILPKELDHKGFRNLAGLFGQTYFSLHASSLPSKKPPPPEASKAEQKDTASSKPADDGKDGDKGPVKPKAPATPGTAADKTNTKRDDWHREDVFVEKEHFLGVMEMAIKTLYNRGFRNFDAI